MNRKQRRAQGRVEQVKIADIVTPQHMTTEECLLMCRLRMSDNMLLTQHPYHHKTGSGVIVTPDPTLDYCLKRLDADPTYQGKLMQLRKSAQDFINEHPDAPAALPVNRKYYGVDPYERH